LIIRVIEGPHKGLVFEHELKEAVIHQSFITIGSDDEVCNIILDKDDDISGEHCVLDWENEQLIFVDRESTNGSKINGKDAGSEVPIVLKSGDEIDIGESRLVLVTIGGII